ncbi:MAG TPA: YqaA family protein [Burkholderiaceae bacterium]|nr:YqaA family protein [Burkholderiaceae bacterium]
MIEAGVLWILGALALPQVGLSSVFLISILSATLLPIGSEPAVFAVIKANDALFWPALAVGTIGNTIGGAIGYGMGYGARQVWPREGNSRWLGWLQRFGPKTLLLAWLPAIGDPLCSLAGWLKLPFWACVGYMAIGKFLRYLAVTWLLLTVPDGFWRAVAHWF